MRQLLMREANMRAAANEGRLTMRAAANEGGWQ